MPAEMISAWASVGTLVVIVATAIAAGVQLRHMRVLNYLTALSDFREEYERIQGAAQDALQPAMAALEDPAVRDHIAAGNALPEPARPLAPLMRLFEILGSYTTRNIIAHDLVTEQWAPVVIVWWKQLEPLIVVLRRYHGPALFENWEALVVRSQRVVDLDRSVFPKSLERIVLTDPWAAPQQAAPPSP